MKLTRNKGLNEKSKKLEINDNPFKKKLKSHQETLLYKVLETDEKNSFSNLPFGLISDKPGSGKTYVILSMIYYSTNFFNSKGINLIVVPNVIFNQWQNSIENFLGNLLKCYYLIDYNQISRLYVDRNILLKNNIILTTPVLYDVLAATLNSLSINVRRTFFDEADTMKNLLMNSIKSGMTWFVSASISSIFDLNKKKAKIGIYDLNLPDLLKNECFCDPKYIDKCVKLKDPIIEIFDCKNFYIDILLNKILDKEQMKFINSHDYSNIKSECLNYSLRIPKDVLIQLLLYSNKIINESNNILKDLEKNKVKAKDITNSIIKKKNFYNDRFELIKSLCYKYNVCMNCFDIIKDKCYSSSCNILYCSNCIDLKCFVCKKYHDNESFKLNNENKIDKITKNFIENTIYDKFFMLDKILEICGDKIIIYSEYNGLNNFLKKHSIDNDYIISELNSGNINEINIIINEFSNNDKNKILLIDNAYFGVGLNLEYGTDIIFFHNTTMKMKNQIVGRAQRFGRTSILNIWVINYLNEN